MLDGNNVFASASAEHSSHFRYFSTRMEMCSKWKKENFFAASFPRLENSHFPMYSFPVNMETARSERVKKAFTWKKLWESCDEKRCCANVKKVKKDIYFSWKRRFQSGKLLGENKFSFGWLHRDSYHVKLLKIDTNWAFVIRPCKSYFIYVFVGSRKRANAFWAWINEKVSIYWLLIELLIWITITWCCFFIV